MNKNALRFLRYVHPVAMADLDVIAEADVAGVHEAARHYSDSWKRRGGVGAFMMLARKWDRLEPQVKKHGWDVFKAIAKDNRAEGVIDDVRDLRRYLLLVEAEMISRGAKAAKSVHRDNKVRKP